MGRPRGQSVVRLLRLAARLQQQPSTIDEIARAMGVHRRTVYRDLITLQSVPLPVTKDQSGRWSIGVSQGCDQVTA